MNEDVSSVISDAEWESHQRAGRELYAEVQQYDGRLKAAQQLVNQLQHNPLELKQEINHIVLLLNQTHAFPGLHKPALELALMIQRWAVYLENWQLWEGELRFFSDVAQALELPEYRSELLNQLANILLHIGSHAEANTISYDALQTAYAAQSALPVAKTAATRGAILAKDGHSDWAVEVLRAAAQFIESQHSTDDQHAEAFAHILVCQAEVYRRLGNLELAVETADEAAKRIIGCVDIDPGLRATIFRVQGLYRWANGQYKEAIPNLHTSARLFRQLGDLFSASMALGNLGLVYWSMARLDEAEEVTAYTVRLARKLNTGWQLTCQIGNLGLVSLFQGRLREAHRHVTHHLHLATEFDLQGEIARAEGNLGVIKMHLGQYKTALKLLENGRRMNEEEGRLESLGGDYVNLSYCYGRLGDPKQALDCAQRALKLSEQLGLIPLKIIASRSFAECLEKQDRYAYLLEIYRLAQDRPFDRVGCLLRMVDTLSRPDRRVFLWEVAQKRLKLMGASAWIHNNSINSPPFLPVLI